MIGATPLGDQSFVMKDVGTRFSDRLFPEHFPGLSSIGNDEDVGEHFRFRPVSGTLDQNIVLSRIGKAGVGFLRQFVVPGDIAV